MVLLYFCIIFVSTTNLYVMKIVKYLLIFALFSVSSIANAQFRFGAKGGMNIVNASFSRDIIKSDNIVGFHVGPTIEAMFGKGGLGFDAAVLYSQRGFDSDVETVKNSYLEVPLNLKFKLGMPLVNPFVAAGPYAGFRIGGGDAKNISSVIDQMKTKSFAGGLNFIAGAEFFNMLQVSINYSWGLTDNYKTFEFGNSDSYRGKSHAWSISAAYYF